MIKVEKLVKNFKKILAVRNVSFEVKKGEIFALLGPNGAGKSTIIKILTTLLEPTSGKAKVNGFDVQKEKDEVRRSFGIVFQDSSTDDDLTAYENMEFHGALYKIPKKIRRQRIRQLLEVVDLWERRDSFMKDFSGGMKRRLEIARGLLHHPKVLFLDEPTLGLDPQTRNHIWSYVKKLNKEEGITIFFTTHYMEEADKISDRIAIVDKGRIIKIGTPDSLKKEVPAVSLEEAFLYFTGYKIREEGGNVVNRMRMIRNSKIK